MTRAGQTQSRDQPARGAADTSEAALRAWLGMRTLVLDRYDRRKAVCDALGISFIRVKALRRLAAGPLTLRELAATLATDPPYTTIMVDDLEGRGLVVRTVHPTDRRAKIVTITAIGKRAARHAERILGEPPEAFARLDADDVASLERIVRAMLAEPAPPPTH